MARSSGSVSDSSNAPLPQSLDPKFLQTRIPADVSLKNRVLGNKGWPEELPRDLREQLEKTLEEAAESFREDVLTRIAGLKKNFEAARDNPIDAMMFPSSASENLFEIKASGAFAGVPGVGTLAGTLHGFLHDLNPSEDKHLAITGLIIDSMQLALARSEDEHFKKAVDEMIRLVGRAIDREKQATRTAHR